MNNPFEPPVGVSKSKFYFLLWKRYFEQGYGITGYIKYMVALFGLSSLNVGATMVLGVLYAVACFIIGYYWYHHGYVEMDNEIANAVNPFMREVRESIKKGVDK